MTLTSADLSAIRRIIREELASMAAPTVDETTITPAYALQIKQLARDRMAERSAKKVVKK